MDSWFLKNDPCDLGEAREPLPEQPLPVQTTDSQEQPSPHLKLLCIIIFWSMVEAFIIFWSLEESGDGETGVPVTRRYGPHGSEKQRHLRLRSCDSVKKKELNLSRHWISLIDR